MTDCRLDTLSLILKAWYLVLYHNLEKDIVNGYTEHVKKKSRSVTHVFNLHNPKF